MKNTKRKSNFEKSCRKDGVMDYMDAYKILSVFESSKKQKSSCGKPLSQCFLQCCLTLYSCRIFHEEFIVLYKLFLMTHKRVFNMPNKYFEPLLFQEFGEFPLFDVTNLCECKRKYENVIVKELLVKIREPYNYSLKEFPCLRNIKRFFEKEADDYAAVSLSSSHMVVEAILYKHGRHSTKRIFQLKKNKE